MSSLSPQECVWKIVSQILLCYPVCVTIGEFVLDTLSIHG